jgi:hypothetical protein
MSFWWLPVLRHSGMEAEVAASLIVLTIVSGIPPGMATTNGLAGIHHSMFVV